MYRLFAFVSISLFISGCVSTKPNGPTQAEILNSWKGHHYSQLVESWGPPSRVYSNGAGGAILVYSSVSRVVQPDYGALSRAGAQAGSGVDLCSDGGCDVYRNATVIPYESYNMMYVDREGNIYHWRTNRKSPAEMRAARSRDSMYTLIGLGMLVVAVLLPY